MKNLWFIIGAIIVLVVAIVAILGFNGPSKKVAGYSISDPNAPKVEIQEKRFDFGKISLNDVAKHNFQIKNTGSNPLVITDLMTSCHCTTAILKVPGQPDSPEFSMQMANWQEEIPPGVEAVVETVYKPAVMPVSGQVSRVITFNTNDPNNKEVQLEVVAVIE